MVIKPPTIHNTINTHLNEKPGTNNIFEFCELTK